MANPIRDGDGTIISGTRSTVAGTFEATGESDAIEGENHIGIQLWGTFVGTVGFRKSTDGGATWRTVKEYTAADDEIYEEVESGILFSFECSAYTSGTVNYRLTTKG